jgi:hypothetical protein
MVKGQNFVNYRHCNLNKLILIQFYTRLKAQDEIALGTYHILDHKSDSLTVYFFNVQIDCVHATKDNGDFSNISNLV